MSDQVSRAAKHFACELNTLVERFRHEYDLTYAEAVGILELVKLGLCVEFQSDEEHDGIDD